MLSLAARPPIERLHAIEYVDANSGAVLEIETMHQFLVWSEKQSQYELDRQYVERLDDPRRMRN